LALTRPVAVDTTTGKNAMNIATTMPDLLPTPSQTMNSGASAIFGISKTFSFNVPILTDRGSKLVTGHGRLLACRLLGITEVPTL
jgi:hypothetical protein